MNKEYSISVIMGIYNCAETLQETLDSLYAQTFQDFEIILCEDGSNDNTYFIAEENTKAYDNIVLLKNDKNLGLNITLNNCLAVANGKYIARMDGDDISMPNRFELEYNFLESHPEYAIVSSNMIYFDENGEFARSQKCGKVEISELVKHSPFSHPACMVRREAYQKVGGYSVGEKLMRVEDYHLWYKMYLNGYRGYNLAECLLMFRDDRNATARRKLEYRFNETYVKYLIVRDFELNLFKYIYCLKPIILGLLPVFLYTYLHKRKLS